jgi:hypothetical protein
MQVQLNHLKAIGQSLGDEIDCHNCPLDEIEPKAIKGGDEMRQQDNWMKKLIDKATEKEEEKLDESLMESILHHNAKLSLNVNFEIIKMIDDD